MNEEETINNDSKYFNLNVLRTNHELFKEEDDVLYIPIRVKRVALPNNGECWEVIEGSKVVMSVKGSRFKKSEREFLRTADGIKFLMDGYKAGVRSVVKLKKEIDKLKL